jgi:hypothetical protein
MPLVEPSQQLIEQQQTGARGQGARQQHETPLTVRQLEQLTIGEASNAKGAVNG